MSEDDHTIHERWARLRFAVVGPLLMAPPEPGQLTPALVALSEKTWRHPGTGEPVRFGFSTLERWYYAARAAQRDPVGALRGRRRADAGSHRRLSTALAQALTAQYRRHPSWSVQLHADNLAVEVHETPALGPACLPMPPCAVTCVPRGCAGCRTTGTAPPPAPRRPSAGSPSARCAATSSPTSTRSGTPTSTSAHAVCSPPETAGATPASARHSR